MPETPGLKPEAQWHRSEAKQAHQRSDKHGPLLAHPLIETLPSKLPQALTRPSSLHRGALRENTGD